jgi:hypothetical protein
MKFLIQTHWPPSCSNTSHDHYNLHWSCVPDLCHTTRWLFSGRGQLYPSVEKLGLITSRSNNCFLNSIYLACGSMTTRQCVTYSNDLRGTLTSRSNNVVSSNKGILNNYLTLKSKVKVPQRLLQYATHHLMVMHPHTKYHWHTPMYITRV